MKKNTTKISNYDFIKKCIKKHGYRYDYSLVNYINNRSKVSIICKIHGVFNQVAGSHVSGTNCRKCSLITSSRSRTGNIDVYLPKFKEKHGDRYDYTKSKYKGLHSKIEILCKKHGYFFQTVANHYNGSGCYDCGVESRSIFFTENPVGWSITRWRKSALISSNFESFKVYIIKCWDDNEVFYKVGRTYSTVKFRFYGYKMPYEYDLIKEIKFENPEDAFNKESYLKRINKPYKYKPLIPFRGMTECFTEIIYKK